MVATVLEITSEFTSTRPNPTSTEPATIIFPLNITTTTASSSTTVVTPSTVDDDDEDEVSLLFFSPELYRHAQEGDVEGVARALDAGADPNGRVRRGGFAPIHTAAYNG